MVGGRHDWSRRFRQIAVMPESSSWRAGVRDRLRRQGVPAHQERLARDRHAAVDLLETGLGISTDRARVARVGIGDNPWRAGLEQTVDEQADEGVAVAPPDQFRLADELV